MKVVFGSDHAGFKLKLKLIAHLEAKGYETGDVGCFSEESCDYPDFAKAAAAEVVGGEAERGVLVCGTGIGMCIAANKVPGIRAAVVTEAFSAEATRAHNDANILCLGARVLSDEKAAELLDIFMDTPFSEGANHIRRISKLEA